MTGGERWATEQLGELLTAGFRPRAWERFLRASFERAAETRGARPSLVRQARTWPTVGLAGSLALAPLLRRARASAPRSWQLIAWWGAVAGMLDWHLGMLEGPHGQRHDRLRSADALSLARLGLVPFVAATSGTSPRDRGLFSALIVSGGLSDLLDGPLARRVGATRLGRDLDTAADVMLKLAAARAGGQAGWLTRRAVRLVAGCQLSGVALVTMSYFRACHRPAARPFDQPGWSAAALLGGLALAPRTGRTGNVLVASASLCTLGSASLIPTTLRELECTGAGSSPLEALGLRRPGRGADARPGAMSPLAT